MDIEENAILTLEDSSSSSLSSSSSSTQNNFNMNTNTRETRISTANTDLLFKLFDNIEQKDRKQVHLHLQSQYKIHRYVIFIEFFLSIKIYLFIQNNNN